MIKYFAVALDPKSKVKYLFAIHKKCCNKECKIEIEIISVKGKSKDPNNMFIANDKFLAISYYFGLCFFDHCQNLRIDYLNINHWSGPHTPIVALFDKKRNARNCFNAKDIIPWDKRFMAPTMDEIKKVAKQEKRNSLILLDSKLSDAVDQNCLEKIFK